MDVNCCSLNEDLTPKKYNISNQKEIKKNHPIV